MLVLTRKLMEKLFIGDDICVTVVRIEGGQVRLGIEAPRDVSVVRSELVPERQSGPSHRINGAGNATPPSEAPPKNNGQGNLSHSGNERADLRIPQALAHGIGNRRRGRSQ